MREFRAKSRFVLALFAHENIGKPQKTAHITITHCVDIAGVASSILATPTMTKPVASDEAAGFLFPVFG
ncbi:hypothetical protein [Sphingobium cupriresistens]|uniref:hypothetical protein n=1 Tax=Sphingobium cupriresistens TaxID=1132417 RepID=UPI000A54F8EC|nr:hypothetical protein [Sphingobium cupriresistens]